MIRARSEADAAWVALHVGLDRQIAVLEVLVQATQAQIRALVALRVERDGAAQLEAAQAEVQARSAALATSHDEVARAAEALGGALGLDGPTSSLSALAFALGPPERDALRERISLLRSLGQALAELQRLAQAHARRGLAAVTAWRTVLDTAQGGIGATYTRGGRARPRVAAPPPAMSLELDL